MPESPLVGHTRSRELMLRWTELAAFGLIYRSHEGNDPEAMLDLVERHVRGAGYHVVDHEPTREERLEHPLIARFVRRHAAGSPLILLDGR